MSRESICPYCAHPFQSYERNGVPVPICHNCETQLVQRGLLAAPGSSPSKALTGPVSSETSSTLFRPLSSLPEGRRLRPRVLTPPDEKVVGPNSQLGGQSASHLPPPLPQPAAEPETGATGLRPRSLPGEPGLRPNKPTPISNSERRIGFNCPACLAILVIKQPDSYDGTAAPCPNCQAIILPPRVVPASPFTLASQPKTPALDDLVANGGVRQVTVGIRSPDRLTDRLSLPSSSEPSEKSEPMPLTPRHIARSVLVKV